MSIDRVTARTSGGSVSRAVTVTVLVAVLPLEAVTTRLRVYRPTGDR
jgi:hypothetical protein